MDPMKRINVRSFSSRESLTDALADELLRVFTLPTDQDYAVILSGGNTPRPVYEKLYNMSASISPHLHLTMSDERMVPPEDNRCNTLHLCPMLNHFCISPDHFLGVNTRLSIEEAARSFDAGIREWVEKKIAFELAVLGLGPDGHTASLFSADDIQRDDGAYAIPVRRPTPPDRVSLTPSVFSVTRRIIILAAGEEKAPMIDTLLTHPLTIPCGMAIKDCVHVELWTDQDISP